MPPTTPVTTPETVAIPKPAQVPNLTWISGNIQQILLQDKEHFYVVTVNDGKKTYNVRFGDPYTGKSDALLATNPMYSLLEKAFFQKESVYMGIRDFGFDPQAGIERIILDRVSVNHM